ncbi:hypothetical protein [Brevundimonas sp.]|uniref:hypothetical protein n=1 Tax=Brevundimonas sp. TaxID=1871086 RepID=UPI002737B7AA|nr:hypothetical protein [Brevundimonas sp.]
MEVINGALGFFFLVVIQPAAVGFMFLVGAPASLFGEPTFEISGPREQCALATALLVFLAMFSLQFGIRTRLTIYGLMAAAYAIALCGLIGLFRPGLAFAFASLGLGFIALTVINLQWFRFLFGPRKMAR